MNPWVSCDNLFSNVNLYCCEQLVNQQLEVVRHQCTIQTLSLQAINWLLTGAAAGSECLPMHEGVVIDLGMLGNHSQIDARQ